MNVGSLPTPGQSVFDFETQSGITHLLASIRASALASTQKNDLRDLVFLYSNGGKDKRVLGSLEQKISEYNLQAVPRKNNPAATQANQPTIGKFRSAPVFKSTVAVRVETKVAPAIDFKNDETWKKQQLETPPAPVVPEPKTVEPVIVSVPRRESVQSAEAPAPAAPENVVPSGGVDTQEASLERIRQIKALVNQKVGNPVNLVDIDNTVGREYMGALLDAMKKINTGSSAGSAMARLEAAYVAVEKTLENRTPDSPAPAPSPTPTPVSVPEPVKMAAPEPVIPTPPPTVTIKTTPTVPVKELAEEPVRPEPINRVPIQNIARELNDSDVSVPIASSKKEVEPHVAETVSRWGAEPADDAHEVRPIAASGIKPLASLADLSHPTLTVQKPTEEKPVPNLDPLHTSEIDSGLDQLLGEWQIFKKSGIFGTGPNGREHPLFKKMAPLQIPLLLAGRFEGATQEIKQSVTDYMNGWRYEQGLIYEQGEMFEHYLRRVIKHILDLQKSKMWHNEQHEFSSCCFI